MVFTSAADAMLCLSWLKRFYCFLIPTSPSSGGIPNSLLPFLPYARRAGISIFLRSPTHMSNSDKSRPFKTWREANGFRELLLAFFSVAGFRTKRNSKPSLICWTAGRCTLTRRKATFLQRRRVSAVKTLPPGRVTRSVQRGFWGTETLTAWIRVKKIWMLKNNDQPLPHVHTSKRS